MRFDPPFPVDHLHFDEQQRIKAGNLSSHELAMLAKGEDPWAKFRGPVLPPRETNEEPPKHPERDLSPEKKHLLDSVQSLLDRVPSAEDVWRTVGGVDKSPEDTVKDLAPKFRDWANRPKRPTGTPSIDAEAHGRPDYGNPSPSQIRQDRMWRAIQSGGRPDPEDIAEEEAEAERYQRKLSEARERKRKEVEAEFAQPENAIPEARQDLTTPQWHNDIRKIEDAVSIPAGNPNDQPWHKRGDVVVAVVLALGAAVLAILVILLPPKSVSAVIFWLMIMFLLLAAAASLIAHYRDWSRIKTAFAIVLMAIAVAAFAWSAWPIAQ